MTLGYPGIFDHFCLSIPFQQSINGIAPMLDPPLQTDDVTHKSLYTEQFLSARAFTERGLCTEKLLHTDAFTHRGFYAKRLLHAEARSSAEPALLLFELLSVFLLPLPDHLPFVFPFPSSIPSIANLGIYLEIPLYNGRQGFYSLCVPSPQVLCFNSGKTVFRPEESSL